MLKSALDLLTDPDEAADLLEVCGVERPADAAAARRLLHEIEIRLGPDAIVTELVRMAGSFALMAEDIFAFCEETGAGIRGQVQLKTENRVFPATSLDSSWAWTCATLGSAAIEERSHSLVARLAGIAEALDPERLVGKGYEMRDTDLGRQLRESPNPMHRVLYESIGRETVSFKVFSESDRRSLAAALEALATAGASLSRVPLPAGVKITFDEIDARCRKALNAMLGAKPGRRECDPALMALSEEIQFVAVRLRTLAADAAEAERAEAGFGDFLRTDFWFQRWRVYEIWILVALLRKLQELGGKVALHRVNQGVWTLRYGRDHEPAATCELGGRQLEVWYQFFEEGEERAYMPDIALLETGRALAVIDPKHGRSYTYSRVDEVLQRYDAKFRAALTAIVNYFPMVAYPFEMEGNAGRRLILASDVAPGTAARRRLDLHLEDALLARGFSSRRIAEIKGPAMITGRHLSDRSALVYFAERSIEVDQPEGPWLSWEQGTEPFPELAEFAGTSVEEIDACGDGQVCVLRTKGRWVLWTSERVIYWENPPDSVACLGWNPQGTRHATLTSQEVICGDRTGTQQRIALPAGAHPLACAAWERDGEAIVFESGDWDWPKTELIRLDLKGTHEVLYEEATPKWPKSRYGEQTMLDLGPRAGVLLRTQNLGDLLVCRGEVRRWEEREIPLSVSPGGRFWLRNGPTSRHSREGVKLIAIREIEGENERDLPLVRFYGPARDERFLWSPDEVRFAFLASRERDKGRVGVLLAARIGERYAESVSLPGQDTRHFAWVGAKLVRAFHKQ